MQLLNRMIFDAMKLHFMHDLPSLCGRHAARIAALTTERVSWEDFKKQQKEAAGLEASAAANEEEQMRKYRAQLDADRAAKLAKVLFLITTMHNRLVTQLLVPVLPRTQKPPCVTGDTSCSLSREGCR